MFILTVTNTVQNPMAICVGIVQYEHTIITAHKHVYEKEMFPQASVSSEGGGLHQMHHGIGHMMGYPLLERSGRVLPGHQTWDLAPC